MPRPSCAASLWQARQRATSLVGWMIWVATFVFAVTAGIGFAFNALFRAIDSYFDEDDEDKSEVIKFFGGQEPSEPYIEGFVEGAVEFFAKVRAQI
jgi:hypothetical protein